MKPADPLALAGLFALAGLASPAEPAWCVGVAVGLVMLAVVVTALRSLRGVRVEPRRRPLPPDLRAGGRWGPADP